MPHDSESSQSYDSLHCMPGEWSGVRLALAVTDTPCVTLTQSPLFCRFFYLLVGPSSAATSARLLWHIRALLAVNPSLAAAGSTPRPSDTPSGRAAERQSDTWALVAESSCIDLCRRGSHSTVRIWLMICVCSLHWWTPSNPLCAHLLYEIAANWLKCYFLSAAAHCPLPALANCVASRNFPTFATFII